MNAIRLPFLLVLIALSAIGLACQPAASPVEGPYFGNGLRNGWGDQHSITLWTRLTTIPDLNQSGIHFLEVSNEAHKRLRKTTDEEGLRAAQIPEGSTLADMDAACPGSGGEVLLRYFSEEAPAEVVEIPWAAVDVGKNYTHQWRLESLSPNTGYQLMLIARKDAQSPPSDTILGFFKTPPAAETRLPIRFSVVTGHDYNRRDDPENGHTIYKSMLEDSLDFYVHTGDIEYYDKPNPYAMTEDLMRYKWDRLFALPFQRNFYRQTTTYFIKDDHDALSNDCYPGMTYGAVTFERGLEIFDKEQFPSNEELYTTIRWGKDLQIWLMEGRNFRSNNKDTDGPDKTIWGAEQKAWLFRTINKSDATYKIIISPTPVLGPDRGKKNDNHANSGFTHEGDEIRNFVNQHDNVFFCVGDRHWQYVSHRANTNLWEFSCGPGSDQHAGGWKESNRSPDHRFLRVKGGYLVGTLEYANGLPQLVFQHRDVNGVMMHEEVFK